MSRRAVACAASICVMLSLLIAGEAGAFPAAIIGPLVSTAITNQSSNRSFRGTADLGKATGQAEPAAVSRRSQRRRPCRALGDALHGRHRPLRSCRHPLAVLVWRGVKRRRLAGNVGELQRLFCQYHSIGADGSLFGTNGGAIGHDADMSGGPTRSIVGTGSGFIAVWTSTLTPTAIWASRLDSAGVLVTRCPSSPVVATNPGPQLYSTAIRRVLSYGRLPMTSTPRG